MRKTPTRIAVAAFAILAIAPHAFAQSGHQSGMHGKSQKGAGMGGHMMAKDSASGGPGEPAKVSRTITITMRDNFFEPEEIGIKAGETVRFVVSNQGQFLHEFSLGTAAMHARHQAEMTTMMQHGMITPTAIDHDRMKMDHGGKPMMHDQGGSLLIEPGKSADLVWTFGKATELEFACNMPGHYEAGMVGPVQFGHGH